MAVRTNAVRSVGESAAAIASGEGKPTATSNHHQATALQNYYNRPSEYDEATKLITITGYHVVLDGTNFDRSQNLAVFADMIEIKPRVHAKTCVLAAPGRNISLNARVIRVNGNVKIDVSGTPAENQPKGNNGKKLQSGQGPNKSLGLEGAAGNPGATGGHAGKINLAAFQLVIADNSRLTLRARGGKGGRGQDGCDGDDGEQGENGFDWNPNNKHDFKMTFTVREIDDEFHLTAELGSFKIGGLGKPGFPGGNGGNAGRQGDGGDGGHISVRIVDGVGLVGFQGKIDFDVHGGKVGDKARAGKGGKGGAGGIGGKRPGVEKNKNGTYSLVVNTYHRRDNGAPGPAGSDGIDDFSKPPHLESLPGMPGSVRTLTESEQSPSDWEENGRPAIDTSSAARFRGDAIPFEAPASNSSCTLKHRSDYGMAFRSCNVVEGAVIAPLPRLTWFAFEAESPGSYAQYSIAFGQASLLLLSTEVHDQRLGRSLLEWLHQVLPTPEWFDQADQTLASIAQNEAAIPASTRNALKTLPLNIFGIRKCLKGDVSFVDSLLRHAIGLKASDAYRDFIKSRQEDKCPLLVLSAQVQAALSNLKNDRTALGYSRRYAPLTSYADLKKTAEDAIGHMRDAQQACSDFRKDQTQRDNRKDDLNHIKEGINFRINEFKGKLAETISRQKTLEVARITLIKLGLPTARTEFDRCAGAVMAKVAEDAEAARLKAILKLVAAAGAIVFSGGTAAPAVLTGGVIALAVECFAENGTTFRSKKADETDEVFKKAKSEAEGNLGKATDAAVKIGEKSIEAFSQVKEIITADKLIADVQRDYSNLPVLLAKTKSHFQITLFDYKALVPKLAEELSIAFTAYWDKIAELERNTADSIDAAALIATLNTNILWQIKEVERVTEMTTASTGPYETRFRTLIYRQFNDAKLATRVALWKLYRGFRYTRPSSEMSFPYLAEDGVNVMTRLISQLSEAWTSDPADMLDILQKINDVAVPLRRDMLGGAFDRFLAGDPLLFTLSPSHLPEHYQRFYQLSVDRVELELMYGADDLISVRDNGGIDVTFLGDASVYGRNLKVEHFDLLPYHFHFLGEKVDLNQTRADMAARASLSPFGTWRFCLGKPIASGTGISELRLRLDLSGRSAGPKNHK